MRFPTPTSVDHDQRRNTLHDIVEQIQMEIIDSLKRSRTWPTVISIKSYYNRLREVGSSQQVAGIMDAFVEELREHDWKDVSFDPKSSSLTVNR